MQYFTIATAVLATAANAADNAVATSGSNSSSSSAIALPARVADLIEIYAHPNNPGTDRALTQSDMGLLSDYGCWCFFESAHGKGKGKPVDEIDSYCKTLHDGYECILADAADAGIDCVPWEVPYNSAFGSGIPTGLTMEGLSQECDNNNSPNTCAAWTCKVEGWFVQQYFLYSTAGGIINSAFRHANGFDQDSGCPISTGVQSEKSCCGSYPLRFPFKTYDGARDCCQTHTFNTNLFQCCPDGHVKMVC